MVGVAVWVAVFVAVGGTGVLVAVTVGIGVLVAVGSGVGVDVAVGVLVGVAVLVGVSVGVSVAVGGTGVSVGGTGVWVAVGTGVFVDVGGKGVPTCVLYTTALRISTTNGPEYQKRVWKVPTGALVFKPGKSDRGMSTICALSSPF